MKKIFFIVVILYSLNTLAQLDNSSLLGMPVVTNLSEITSLTGVTKGAVAYVDNEKSLYIYNGTNWVKILDNSPIITNEILVEDANYIYVSVRINTNNWMVTRFHRNDINTETNAMGTGAQPTILTAISALTYN